MNIWDSEWKRRRGYRQLPSLSILEFSP